MILSFRRLLLLQNLLIDDRENRINPEVTLFSLSIFRFVFNVVPAGVVEDLSSSASFDIAEPVMAER